MDVPNLSPIQKAKEAQNKWLLDEEISKSSFDGAMIEFGVIE